MYDTSTINTSATIVAPTGVAIQDGSFLAVKFNDAGAFVLAAAGDVPVGIIPGGVQDTLSAGEDLTVQIKDIGQLEEIIRVFRSIPDVVEVYRSTT